MSNGAAAVLLVVMFLQALVISLSIVSNTEDCDRESITRAWALRLAACDPTRDARAEEVRACLERSE